MIKTFGQFEKEVSNRTFFKGTFIGTDNKEYEIYLEKFEHVVGRNPIKNYGWFWKYGYWVGTSYGRKGDSKTVRTKERAVSELKLIMIEHGFKEKGKKILDLEVSEDFPTNTNIDDINITDEDITKDDTLLQLKEKVDSLDRISLLKLAGTVGRSKKPTKEERLIILEAIYESYENFFDIVVKPESLDDFPHVQEGLREKYYEPPTEPGFLYFDKENLSLTVGFSNYWEYGYKLDEYPKKHIYRDDDGSNLHIKELDNGDVIELEEDLDSDITTFFIDSCYSNISFHIPFNDNIPDYTDYNYVKKRPYFTYRNFDGSYGNLDYIYMTISL